MSRFSREELAASSETAYEDGLYPKIKHLPGYVLTVTPFPIQLCGEVVEMAEMPSLCLAEFTGKVLDDVRGELLWE